MDSAVYPICTSSSGTKIIDVHRGMCSDPVRCRTKDQLLFKLHLDLPKKESITQPVSNLTIATDQPP